MRHLILAKEMLAATLISIHNLQTLIELAQEIRQAILDQRLEAFVNDYFEKKRAVLQEEPAAADLNPGLPN